MTEITLEPPKPSEFKASANGMTIDIKKAMLDIMTEMESSYEHAYPNNLFEEESAHTALQGIIIGIRSLQSVLKSIT
jgi:hypothetical protein